MTNPTLLSPRLRLRAWTELDAEAFHGLWGDPRVIWWGHDATPEASLRRLGEMLAACAKMPEGLGWWAVEDRDTGRPIGNAILRPAPYDDSIELGYHLAHSAWGHGYATEAAVAVLVHGFFALALPRVFAVVQVENHASHRVIARVGMEAKGPITFNGMPHILYGLEREDALALDWAAPNPNPD